MWWRRSGCVWKSSVADSRITVYFEIVTRGILPSKGAGTEHYDQEARNVLENQVILIGARKMNVLDVPIADAVSAPKEA